MVIEKTSKALWDSWTKITYINQGVITSGAPSYWVLTWLRSLFNVINTLNGERQHETEASRSLHLSSTNPNSWNNNRKLKKKKKEITFHLDAISTMLKSFKSERSLMIRCWMLCVRPRLHFSIYYRISGSVIHAKWNENLLSNMQISLCKAALPMVHGRQLMPLISLSDIL